MKKVLAALALIGLCVAPFAEAANNVQNMGPYFINAQTGQLTDASGNAKVVNSNDGTWTYFPNVISNQLTASGAGMSDSSNTLSDTHACAQLALLLGCQFDSLSTDVRLAVQIRGHYNTVNDSSATFPWMRWPYRGATTVVSNTSIDSLGQFVTGISVPPATAVQATSANSVGSALWPGEFMVKFSMTQNDTTGLGNGKPGGFPNRQMILLNDSNGVPFWAPATSIRVRVINGVRNRFKITASLVGRNR